jgi:hypothetical protein
MLNIENRRPVVLAIPGMGHSLDHPEVADVVWTGIAGFLQQHLGAASAPASTTTVKKTGVRVEFLGSSVVP